MTEETDPVNWMIIFIAFVVLFGVPIMIRYSTSEGVRHFPKKSRLCQFKYPFSFIDMRGEPIQTPEATLEQRLVFLEICYREATEYKEYNQEILWHFLNYKVASFVEKVANWGDNVKWFRGGVWVFNVEWAAGLWAGRAAKNAWDAGAGPWAARVMAKGKVRFESAAVLERTCEQSEVWLYRSEILIDYLEIVRIAVRKKRNGLN